MRLACGMLLFTCTAVAAPDPQPAEAYRWRILVRTPNHPLFDAAFRANLARELKAALQPGLGLLGAVEVIDTADSKDPVAVAFREQGIAMVRKYDHVKPRDLKRWLDYVGMSEAEFDAVADTFRDSRVWRKNARGEWEKDNIWDEAAQ